MTYVYINVNLYICTYINADSHTTMCVNKETNNSNWIIVTQSIPIPGLKTVPGICTPLMFCIKCHLFSLHECNLHNFSYLLPYVIVISPVDSCNLLLSLISLFNPRFLNPLHYIVCLKNIILFVFSITNVLDYFKYNKHTRVCRFYFWIILEYLVF